MRMMIRPKPPKKPNKMPAPSAFLLFTNAKMLPPKTSIVKRNICSSVSINKLVKISIKIRSIIGMTPRKSPPMNSRIFDVERGF